MTPSNFIVENSITFLNIYFFNQLNYTFEVFINFNIGSFSIRYRMVRNNRNAVHIFEKHDVNLFFMTNKLANFLIEGEFTISCSKVGRKLKIT